MMTSVINFFFSGVKPTLTDRTRLKKFIITIFKNEKRVLESISFIFTNDKSIHTINKRFLNHDYFTDIITFDLSPLKSPTVAEVYISYNRVKENAIIHKSSLKEELHRVIFHGILHLCGYNDKTRKQIKEIRSKEDFYLATYFKNVSRDTLKRTSSK